MAEFNFYINDKERTELVNFILSKQASIVIDKEYSGKSYEIIHSREDYMLRIEKGECKYFLTHDSFTHEPLSLLPLSTRPKFFIYQRKGGPYIDLFFLLGFSEGATIPYKRSWISYYSRYIHFDSHNEFPAPENLKILYKEIITFIKSICKSIKKNGKTYWISREVLLEMEG